MGLAVKADDGTPERLHEPVMVAEVCGALLAHQPASVVDLTLGTGGHAQALLEGGCGRLIGLDRDRQALAIAGRRLDRFGSRVALFHADFASLDSVLDEAGVGQVDAILADLGMSSFALDDPARGFSFRQAGPLDMRMDGDQRLRAYDIVNEETQDELTRILREYGEERYARRIASMIVRARRRQPIETTAELRLLIERAMGPRRRGVAHPATRSFQALRIAVNDELKSLEIMLRHAPARLAAGGRMAIIAYHSLEDRTVKECFRELVRGGGYSTLTGRVVRPSSAEVARNSRARSARLRSIERGGR